MNYGEIKKTDIANGEGVRVTLFVSGCRVHCKGCFNAVTWDFNYGNEFTEETAANILNYLAPAYISGLSVLGGEPFEEENQKVLTPFLKKVKETYPNKNIWCYSGYIFDKDLAPENGSHHFETTDEMLSYIDVLVDGPFQLEDKDLMLKFRGSSNQRILKLENGKVSKILSDSEEYDEMKM